MNDSVLFSSKSIDWSTPQELFDALDKRFQFTLDVCASDKNAKVKRYFTRELDGLGQSWGGERCWMNPPYGREIGPWVKKAHREAEHGALVVGLLPARPETRWWQEHERKGRPAFYRRETAVRRSKKLRPVCVRHRRVVGMGRLGWLVSRQAQKRFTDHVKAKEKAPCSPRGPKGDETCGFIETTR